MPTTEGRQFDDILHEALLTRMEDTVAAGFSPYLPPAQRNAVLTLLADLMERTKARLTAHAEEIERSAAATGDFAKVLDARDCISVIEECLAEIDAVPLLAPEGRADG